MAKKSFLILVLMSMFLTSTHAQEIFSKGDRNINLGIGVGNYFGGTLGGTNYHVTIPPISVSYDQCIIDGVIKDNGSIGVGGYVAYAANQWEGVFSGDNYGYKYTYIILGGRGTFHYQFIDKLDTYAGAMLGYDIVRSSSFGNISHEYGLTATGSGVAYNAFVGARYYFSDKFAAYAEAGYGITALELGISFKF